MNLKPNRGEEPEVSLVAMIDVVLMLLIFFVLSTSFIHPGQIHVTLPQASATGTPKNAPITVTITRNGSFLVNGRALVNAKASTLKAAFEKVSGAEHKQPIIVRADKRSDTQAIVTVMDVAGSLGFKHVNIVTTQTGGGT